MTFTPIWLPGLKGLRMRIGPISLLWAYHPKKDRRLIFWSSYVDVAGNKSKPLLKVEIL